MSRLDAAEQSEVCSVANSPWEESTVMQMVQSDASWTCRADWAVAVRGSRKRRRRACQLLVLLVLVLLGMMCRFHSTLLAMCDITT